MTLRDDVRRWAERGLSSAGARATAVVALALAFVVLARWGRADVLDPDPPVVSADVAPREAPPSTIGIPLAIPLDILVRLLEEAVPGTHGTVDSLRGLPNRGRTSVAIALQRAPFRVSLVDNVARIETTLRYRLRLAYDLPGLPDPGGSCGFGEGRPGLAVALLSPVSLDRDWGLRTRAQVVTVRPASSLETDRCEVTPLGLDVTDRVAEGARAFLVDHLDDIDRRAALVDTRSSFEGWWRTLQQPIALDDSLWLVIGPEAIRRGPVGGSGDSLRVALAVRARPRIQLGRRPDVPFLPLPALDSGRLAPRLDLRVDGRAEYDAASQFLTDRLADQWVDLGGLSLRLGALRVYGIGAGKLALEVRLSGDLTGRLYLTGTPTLDAAGERISVPDLEFDVATERAMFGLMPALVAMPLRDRLRGEASWPVDPAVAWLGDWLRKGINRDLSADLRVAGVVDTVVVEAVYAQRKALIVRLSARGSASLLILGDTGATRRER